MAGFVRDNDYLTIFHPEFPRTVDRVPASVQLRMANVSRIAFGNGFPDIVGITVFVILADLPGGLDDVAVIAPQDKAKLVGIVRVFSQDENITAIRQFFR